MICSNPLRISINLFDVINICHHSTESLLRLTLIPMIIYILYSSHDGNYIDNSIQHCMSTEQSHSHKKLLRNTRKHLTGNDSSKTCMSGQFKHSTCDGCAVRERERCGDDLFAGARMLAFIIITTQNGVEVMASLLHSALSMMDLRMCIYIVCVSWVTR